MSRSQAVLNAVTVLLLLFLGLGTVLMPRYNYALIGSRLGVLEKKSVALENGFEKLNILAGPGEEKRAAVLSNLDLLAVKTRNLDEDLVSFLANSAEESSRLEEAFHRIAKFESLLRSMHAPPGPAGGGDGVAGPISKGEGSEIAKALAVSPRGFAEMDFDKFLAFAAERGLMKSLAPSVERAASQGLPAEARPLFEGVRTCIIAINQSESLFIQELVEKATQAGDYEEEDEAEPGDSKRPLQAPSQGGVVYAKSLGNGKNRVFRLSMEDHPEFPRFERLRDEALRSFFVSLESLLDKQR